MFFACSLCPYQTIKACLMEMHRQQSHPNHGVNNNNDNNVNCNVNVNDNEKPVMVTNDISETSYICNEI